MRQEHTYQALATSLQAIRNLESSPVQWKEDDKIIYCQKIRSPIAIRNLWKYCWRDRIRSIMETAPSGSGIDTGVTLEEEECSDNKLVFSFGFHHMDEHGGYDGWTQHKLTVKPTFNGITMKISGRDRNMIKDYLYSVFNIWLHQKEIFHLKIPAKDYKGD